VCALINASIGWAHAQPGPPLATPLTESQLQYKWFNLHNASVDYSLKPLNSFYFSCYRRHSESSLPHLHCIYHYTQPLHVIQLLLTCVRIQLQKASHVRRRNLKQSLFVLHTVIWVRLEILPHQHDWLSSLLQESVEVWITCKNDNQTLEWHVDICSNKVPIWHANTISISLWIHVPHLIWSLSTSVHGYWYHCVCHGWLRDKNLTEEALSSSHGDMLMVSNKVWVILLSCI